MALSVHVFVDETKANGLLVAAARVQPRQLAPTRTLLRGLLLARQERLHFTKEGKARQGQIAAALCRTGVVVDLYDARTVTDQRAARRLVLERLVTDLAVAGAHRLVLEQDDSLLASDRRILRAAVHAAGVADELVYEHLPPRSEPLLWIADAVAWCWTHGSTWQERVRPIVGDVHRLS